MVSPGNCASDRQLLWRMPFGEQSYQGFGHQLHLVLRVEEVEAEADACRVVHRPGHYVEALLECSHQLSRRPVLQADGHQPTGGFRGRWAQKVTALNGRYPLSQQIGKAHGTPLYLVYAYVNNRWVSCVATGAVEFMEKTAINQRVETLKIRGAGTLRALAKDRAQDELADLLNVADKRLETARQQGWVDLDETDSDATETSINIFEQLANAELHQLPTTTWSQP